jgi:hypothetical protein
VVDKSGGEDSFCLSYFPMSFNSPAARSVSVLTLLDCTFRANLNLVLINKDIWAIPTPQKKFTAWHLSETLLSK